MNESVTISVNELKISERIKRILRWEGYDTVEKLVSVPPQKLLKIRGFGESSLIETIKALERLNLDTSMLWLYVKKIKRFPYNLLGDIDRDIYPQNDIKEKIISIIETLPDNYCKLIKMYYIEGKSLNECGKALNVGYSRVTKMKKKALNMISHYSRFQYLINNESKIVDEVSPHTLVQAIPIIQLHFPVKTENFLISNGFETIGDIVDQYPRIKEIKGIGEKTLDDISAKLKIFGVELED